MARVRETIAISYYSLIASYSYGKHFVATDSSFIASFIASFCVHEYTNSPWSEAIQFIHHLENCEKIIRK